jgi:hypothetical protein
MVWTYVDDVKSWFGDAFWMGYVEEKIVLRT